MSAQAVCAELWLSQDRIDYESLKMAYSDCDIALGISLFIREKQAAKEIWGKHHFSYPYYMHSHEDLKPVTYGIKRINRKGMYADGSAYTNGEG